MSYAKFEIRRYLKTGEDSWSSSYDTIPIGSVDLKEGIEATKDTFSFSVINANKIYADTFHIDDRIALYMWRDKETASDTDLVIDGMITSIDYTLGAGGRKIKIKGANRTQYLLGNLIMLTWMTDNNTVDEAIRQVIRDVNNKNQASPEDPKYIYGGTLAEWNSIGNATTKSNGDSFPEKSFIWNWQPAYKAIEQWSTNEFTDDGGYIYWIDTDGYFHWIKKPSSVSYTFTEGDNKINALSISKGSWDVFNALIISVGKDCYGHGNHILVYNPKSMVDVGTKWKFINKDSITANIINNEINSNPSLFSLGDDGEPTSLFPSAYPYDMQFYLLDSNYNQQSPATKTVNNDAEYNLQIRRQARLQGKIWGKDVLDRSGEIQHKGKIELNGTLDYVKGNMCSITIPSFNISGQKLRIMDIQHRFSTRGWTTILKVEEDIEMSVGDYNGRI